MMKDLSINLKKYFPAPEVFPNNNKEEANNRLMGLLSDKGIGAAKKYGSRKKNWNYSAIPIMIFMFCWILSRMILISKKMALKQVF